LSKPSTPPCSCTRGLPLIGFGLTVNWFDVPVDACVSVCSPTGSRFVYRPMSVFVYGKSAWSVGFSGPTRMSCVCGGA
jgi:hypothetical protein